MKTFLTCLFFLSVFFSEAQRTARVNIVPRTPKVFQVSARGKWIVTSTTTIGDTLKIEYPTKKKMAVRTVETPSIIPSYVSGAGTLANPYKIDLTYFAGLGCPHSTNESYTISLLRSGTDTLVNVIWSNGVSSIEPDIIVYGKDDQKLADSLYQEYNKKVNGIRPKTKFSNR